MKLSKEQLAAIKHDQGPALILAVPGAGKTTVLVHRTYNLISRHRVDPKRILSITFSRASALDMKKRFQQLFPQARTRDLHFSTIHAFTYGLLREYAYIKSTDYQLIEDQSNNYNKYRLLRQIYYKHNNDYISEDKLDNLLNYMSYMKNMMLSLEEFTESRKIEIENFKAIYQDYESFKRKNRLLDFDDLLVLSLEILRNDKYLLDKYRAKYDYIQLDEGQDTSKIQMELVKILAYPKNNLLIVADDDQSIYGFRGAFPQGLLNFEKEFKGAKFFFMEENYRSSKNIVASCNKFIKTNEDRYEKNIFTNNDYHQPISIIKLADKRDQYSYILEDLKDKDLSQVAILFRNNLSAIGLIELLEREGIEFYNRDKKLRFFNHWLIKDIINILKFSKDAANISLYEDFYYKIKGYISKRQIAYAKTLNPQQNVFDRIGDFPGISDYYKRTLRELKLDFKKISRMKPVQAIEYIEYNLEYDSYLRDNSLKFGFTYDNLSSMLFYLKIIAENSKNLEDLMTRLSYIRQLSASSEDNDSALTLTTIHSAKGLEFEHVYMVDLNEGEFPSSSSIEEERKGNAQLLEEERRLFYVGMSRAKGDLKLLTPTRINGKKLYPSLFLKELEANK